jgi:hypothetical protein
MKRATRMPWLAITASISIAAPANVAAAAAVPAAAPAAPTVAVDSKPAAVEEKSPVSIAVKHIGRGSNQFMPDSYVSLFVMLKNDGKKAIKATKGTIVIYDTFGDDLVHLNIENAKTILPGKAVIEAGEWQIIGKHEALNAINGDSAGTSKLAFAFIPKVILFQEGSKFDQYPIIGAVALAALRRRLSYQFQLIQQRD